MSPRISLTRIIAINWYGFRQIFDVDESVLISGAFGTGKSALLDEVDSPQVGYWHDFGHAQIKENLAFLDHAEWLRAIGPRTVGCHVQDCIWPAQDHQPPFAGDVDLEKLVPLLPSNCLFVWEMSPRKTADEIRRSMQIWRQHFGE